MSPGAQRLRELPGSARAPLGPSGGGASLGSPTPDRPPHSGPTTDPPPTLAELKSNFPGQPRRRVGPFPRPGPPHLRTRPGHPPRNPAPSADLAYSSQPPPPRPPRAAPPRSPGLS
ncbi:proline-rich proteoglycan 2-like isoform X2 [Suricata suricatta]|uniref:proline-rich proteoglycan 2-like isoform X2 n=1 Tax=Suricata suricatta TaxID=37032 RepID=UPI001155704B|nr:proline-rich proteoglycan 2-like isoform X2 [Suricata suricatta]